MREEDGAAVGEAEFVPLERRDTSRICGRGVVKVVASVEGGVAQEFEDGAVHAVGAGAGEDVGEAGGSPADLRGHDAGLRTVARGQHPR